MNYFLKPSKAVWFRKTLAVTVILIGVSAGVKAQTDEDGIMMPKKNFCGGVMYSHSSWNHYWEGTFKRNNPNIGTVATQMIGLMGTYGLTNKLNVQIGVPYVTTTASAGTLHSQHGIQDLSLWVKWQALKMSGSMGTLSVYLVGGGSLPLTNYIADYLPLSIGMHSKTLSGRLLIDYQERNFFATASGTYTRRGDITIDRNAYYTTEMHLTNKVDMPDMISFNFRTGYRSNRLVLEAVLSNMITLGGFDIRKNDMPFPSNKMNATMMGGHFRYDLPVIKRLSLTGGAAFTIAGRNVGQATSFDAGVYYILDFSPKKKQK